MAKQKFTHFVPRDKPPKRPRRHKKRLNKSEKRSYKKYNSQGRHNMAEIIGENTFLKLRKEKEQMKNELEQVKIQRDIALRKLNKVNIHINELLKIIDYAQKK
jgi:hypothetical protein